MIWRSAVAFLLVFSWALQAHQKTEEEFWAEVQFGPEDWLSSGELSQKNCWGSEDHMLGCLLAIEAVLKEGGGLLTLSWNKASRQLSLETSGTQVFQQGERFRGMAEELFGLKRRRRPDLPGLFLKAFHQAQITQSQQAKVTAKAVSAFLQAVHQDPYARIEVWEALKFRLGNSGGPGELVNLEVKVVDFAEGRWLQLRVRSFEDDHLCRKVMKALLRAQSQEVNGVILDLRSNPGGILEQGICLAGIFLGGGVHIASRDSLVEGQLRVNMVQKGAFKTDLPTVVLINESSASASEIVAGALQDHGRAWLVGERSFGKGTIQGGEEYLGQSFQGRHQLILFRTREWFYLPSGRTPQALGVSPDFRVPFKPGLSEEESFALREADLYPDPRIQEEAELWVQPRPEEVQDIQECLNQQGLAEKAYTTADEVHKPSLFQDFQLLMAAEVLACSTSH